MEKALKCQLCGTADWEWDEKQGGHRYAYDPVEHRCEGCARKEAGRSKDPHRNTAGITIELEPRGTVDAAKREMRARKLAMKS